MLLQGVLGNIRANRLLVDAAFERLLLVRDLRIDEIEKDFQERIASVETMARSTMVHSLWRDLTSHYDEVGMGQKDSNHSSQYEDIASEHSDFMLRFVQDFAYDDVFLIHASSGRVAYSVRNRTDLGTNLFHGPYADSGLSRVWRKVMRTRDTCLVDFSSYEPVGQKQAAFIGTPIWDDQENVIAIMAVLITPDFVNRIMDSREGLGATGESYFLYFHKNKNSFSLRSDLSTIGGGKFVVGYDHPEVLDYWHDAVKHGAEGGKGTYLDSEGSPVLVTYGKMAILDLDWYFVSKIDQLEVLGPVMEFLNLSALIMGILLVVVILEALFLSRSITAPVIADVEFTEAISAGNLDVELPEKRQDELGRLAKSLNAMKASLKEWYWLRSRKEHLDDALRLVHVEDEVAHKVVNFFVDIYGADLGVIYLGDGQKLQLMGGYAFSDREKTHQFIEYGEGFVGQAAIDGEMKVFSVSKDAPSMNYGVGEIPLSHYLAIPFFDDEEERALGVLLLGAEHSFTKLQLQFAQENIDSIGGQFRSARSRATIQNLLDDSRAQHEELVEAHEALKASEAELQAQQEELRVTNEELEEQTRALKESERELQTQQEELRVTNEELEERTKALQEQKETVSRKNQDLADARDAVEKKAKDLEMTSRYKSEFLANMSHELRTPLNSVIILSQLLAGNKENNLSSKQVDLAEAIHKSGHDLLSIINDILDLSKVEAGRIDLHLEDIAIADIVADVNRHFAESAKKKSIQFSIDVDPNTPSSIQTDQLRLQQILRNLLSNAMKFAPEGMVNLTIRPAQANEQSQFPHIQNAMAFSVQDDGIGIAQDKQQVIFDAFRQADGSTSRNFGGTGLGLSITRELAELLGGGILLQSEEGKGSCFTLVLSGIDSGMDVVSSGVLEPFAAQRKTVFPSKSQFKVNDDRFSLKEGHGSILIIEDDSSFAQVVCDAVREKGFQALVAGDGEDGLQLSQRYNPSAIILDIGLPGIDGWAVFDELKSNPQTRTIPVHFLSGREGQWDALRSGALGFLSKPVRQEELDAAITRIQNIVERDFRRLLFVGHDVDQEEHLRQLLGTKDLEIVSARGSQEALSMLQEEEWDCIVLQLSEKSDDEFFLLDELFKNDNPLGVPILLTLERELSVKERTRLNEYSEGLVVKGVKTPEALLDEITLFLHKVVDSLPEDSRRLLQKHHSVSSDVEGKSILLVDDDMRNVFALASVLEDQGYEVSIARDGVECLEKLEANPQYDLVLMDIMMPRMNGIEAMKKIREQEQFAQLPIIALTAKAMKEDRRESIEAGANDFLSKPVDTGRLSSLLKVWLYAR